MDVAALAIVFIAMLVITVLNFWYRNKQIYPRFLRGSQGITKSYKYPLYINKYYIYLYVLILFITKWLYIYMFIWLYQYSIWIPIHGLGLWGIPYLMIWGYMQCCLALRTPIYRSPMYQTISYQTTSMMYSNNQSDNCL